MLIALRLSNIIFLFELLRSMVFTIPSVSPYRGQKPLREGPYPIPKPQIPTIGIRDATALLGAILFENLPVLP